MTKYVISDNVFYELGLKECGFYPLSTNEGHDLDKRKRIRSGDIVIVNLSNMEQLKKRSNY